MKENFVEKNEAYQPKIKIIGVGGCGLNVTNYLCEKLKDIETFTIQTDKQLLELSKLDENHKILIGKDLTQGLGTGGNTLAGEKAALESQDKIKEIVKDADLVFFFAGAAGGLGSGATPVITKIAKSQGAINIVFAVTPAKFEGEKKNGIAEKTLKKLNEKQTGVDSIINVSNERFIELVNRKSTLNDVFNFANKEISKCIKAFVDIFQEEIDIISVKFKDFKNFMTNVGFTGIGISKKHKFDEIKSAIEEVMNYPLIKGSFESAEKVIISIQGGSNLTLNFVHGIVEEFTNKIKEDAEVMLSVRMDDDDFSCNEVQITVITA